jgi:Protein of unknown function (DUF3987)
MDTDWGQQVDTVIRFCRTGKALSKGHRSFPTVVQWLTNFPVALGETKRRELIEAICKGYALTESELLFASSGLALPHNGAGGHIELPNDEETALEALLPKGGWFEWYVEYTRKTEAPLSYHLFCSLCVLGASLGRRVFKEKGHFSIYPNYWVVLVGPPGRVKKTSAIDIARKLVAQAALCPIMSDKLTPEALVESLAASGHHFVYAPEFSVLLGRQKYLEGLSTLLLRLADCPDQWEAKTIGRGTTVLTNIALTVLGGSTMSLLAGATPDMVTSSGFLNRFVLVVEQDTQRMFPEPEKGASSLEEKLLKTLERLKGWSGSAGWRSDLVRDMHRAWYYAHKEELRRTDNEMMAEALDRLDVHLERTAMLVHLVQCDDLQICERCLDTSIELMNFIKKRMPQTVAAMTQTSRTSESDYVMGVLLKMGGAADHSRLMRRCSGRMDSTMFKRAVGTLVETKQIRSEKRGLSGTYYILEGSDERIE